MLLLKVVSSNRRCQMLPLSAVEDADYATRYTYNPVRSRSTEIANDEDLAR